MSWSIYLTIDTGGPESHGVWDCCELGSINHHLKTLGFDFEVLEGMTAGEIRERAVNTLERLRAHTKLFPGVCYTDRHVLRFTEFVEACKRHPACKLEIVGR